MRKIVSVGLLVAAMLTFFPPVRPIRVERASSWSGRTCLLAPDIYESKIRLYGTQVSTETTAIDLPRLVCELLCLGSIAGFLIALRSDKQSQTDDPAVNSSPT